MDKLLRKKKNESCKLFYLFVKSGVNKILNCPEKVQVCWTWERERAREEWESRQKSLLWSSMASAPISNVFVYGSLLADDVVRALLGRVPSTSPAVLPNQSVSLSYYYWFELFPFMWSLEWYIALIASRTRLRLRQRLISFTWINVSESWNGNNCQVDWF